MPPPFQDMVNPTRKLFNTPFGIMKQSQVCIHIHLFVIFQKFSVLFVFKNPCCSKCHSLIVLVTTKVNMLVSVVCCDLRLLTDCCDVDEMLPQFVVMRLSQVLVLISRITSDITFTTEDRCPTLFVAKLIKLQINYSNVLGIFNFDHKETKADSKLNKIFKLEVSFSQRNLKELCYSLQTVSKIGHVLINKS